MLLHLQEFSQKLLAHTHGIQDQVDSVIHEAKVSCYVAAKAKGFSALGL